MEIIQQDANRIIQFLSQYREWLKTQKYPPYEYRADAIEDLIEKLKRGYGYGKQN